MHIVDYLKYILLAFTQGISEVLPISSSGHLQIGQKYLGMDISSFTFSIFLHFGSLLAMLFFYRKSIISLIRGFIAFTFKKARDENSRHFFHLSICILVSSIPAGVVGILFKDVIEEYFSDVFFIGLSFILTGVLLTMIKPKKEKTIKDLSYKDAICIGLFQAIGIMPGISRSGITIFGCNKRKLESEDSANYTFLLFMPVALGSFLLEIISFLKGSSEVSLPLIPSLISIILTAVVTFLSLTIFLKIIKKGKIHYFSYYLFLIGLLILVTNF